MRIGKLTVGIPNYNHAHFLPVALNSVLAQSVLPAEVIVVDDASTDDSVAVVSEFARQHPSVRMIRNETNGGALAAVNRTLEESTQEYWYGLSADDKVLPGFFERALEELERFPQAGMCAVAMKFLDPDGNPIRRKDLPSFHTHEEHGGPGGYLSPVDVLERVRTRPWFLAGMVNILFRRQALLEAGGVVPELGASADWFATHYVALKYGMCYIPEPLAAFRIMPDSFGLRTALRPSVHQEMSARMIRRMKQPQNASVFPKAFVERQRKNFTYASFRGAMVHWQTTFASELRHLAPPGSFVSRVLLRLLRMAMTTQWLLLKIYCYRNVATALRDEHDE